MSAVSHPLVMLNYLFHFFIADKFEWSCPDWTGIASRYEHSAFIADCNPKKVHVFGGAQQATNLNDVQALDLGTFVLLACLFACAVACMCACIHAYTVLCLLACSCLPPKYCKPRINQCTKPLHLVYIRGDEIRI